RRRDRKAFDELFERHQRAAYSLALHITGDPEAAEENVQEAMLKVWLSASSFRAEGTVRSWLLRIVARESLKTLKSARRKQTAMDLDFDQLPTSAAVEDPAESELSQALRDKLQTLPALERQLVGLHYGGGLTQAEIGETLSMPQQTISYKLNEALKTLRSNLKSAGFAAAAPLLESGKLCDALSGGHAAPATLQAKVTATLSAKSTGTYPSARRSKRAMQSSAKSGSGSGLMMAGAAAAVCIVVVVALNNQTPAATLPATPVAKIPPPPAPVLAKAPEPAAAPEPVKPAEKPEIKEFRLTFEKQPPEMWVTFKEPWTWNKETKSMECPNGTHLVMPYNVGNEPLHVQFKARYMDAKKTMNMGFTLWMEKSELPTREVWNAHHTQTTLDLVNDVYVWGPYVAEISNGKVARLIVYDRDHGGSVPLVRINNLSVSEIWYRHITEKDIPPELKDLNAVRAKLTRKPEIETANKK
ncbi:MAG TPA: sigma-70 family RNA polymerase sigma factor, partial [Planctomycetota bacterium]|nr:sigma-70 family RNA polymerase sigma factor [Planctomycetota bacterium]